MRTHISHWLTKPAAEPGDLFLYRFMKRDGVDKTFDSWKLRFNTWAAMNDPRERKQWRTTDLVSGGLRAVPTYTQDSLEAEFDRLLRRSARLACFTDDREPEHGADPKWLLQRGWARSAMWDRYADSHRGACLVLNGPALVEQLDMFPLDVGAIRSWGRVAYEDAPIQLGLDADVTSDDHLRDILDEMTIEERGVVAKLYATKLMDWSSEREFRAIEVLWDLPPGANLDEPLDVPLGDSLLAVILGEGHPPITAADLLDRIPHRARAPEILRCDWQGGVPFLEPVA